MRSMVQVCEALETKARTMDACAAVSSSSFCRAIYLAQSAILREFAVEIAGAADGLATDDPSNRSDRRPTPSGCAGRRCGRTRDGADRTAALGKATATRGQGWT